ncbi:MAG: heavy metal translocating P-type ATPase [Pseudomonadota bacterium]
MNQSVEHLQKDLNSPDESHSGQACFHCGLRVPEAIDLTANIDGVNQPMCCYGCQAVARAIVNAGHSSFYRFRTANSITGRELIPEFVRDIEIYDSKTLRQQFTQQDNDQLTEVSLMLEGITCAACIWLIEKTLESIEGVVLVRVNFASQRAWVKWDDSIIHLSGILQAIARVGYRAMPFNPGVQQQAQKQKRQSQQRRIAVAGLFGMQVMMLSISLYVGAWSGMEAEFDRLFKVLSLILSLPVVLYAALPFYRSAIRDLRHLNVTMDVPVSIAILIAFVASVWATYDGHGHVYFDSMVMFVFFLSASRYFEMIARQRSLSAAEKMIQSMPAVATRVRRDGRVETIPAQTLVEGDRVIVAPGETVPADGQIVKGQTSCDEALLTGESLPVAKSSGDALLGGSVNLSHPVTLEIKSVGSETVLSQIQQMVEKAQADKPALVRLADRVAGRFISLVLFIVIATACIWWLKGSEGWFEIALSVLIVSCPCALSLAVPTALSVAIGKLQSNGLLVKRASSLEGLNQVTHIVFDKTGTLTRGKPELSQCVSNPELTLADCLQIAVSLETHSEHPLACALLRSAPEVIPFEVKALLNAPGEGIQGEIDGQPYFIGNAAYIERVTGIRIDQAWCQSYGTDQLTTVVLSNREQVMACYYFCDQVRDEAQGLIQDLISKGYQISLLSGDREGPTKAIAEQVGITHYASVMTPQRKAESVADLQSRGEVVLMIGDGINDAPVLASADYSIAMGSATAVAKGSADLLLLSDHLSDIKNALGYAHQTQSVVRQNLGWALTYNLSAIPAAALGFVAPWMAALGMSFSSLLVVLNALRLSR